jgi:hypothetical protein
MRGLSTPTVLYRLAFLAGLAWSLYLFLNSPGSPVQDEVGHYLFSKSAWQFPELALNLWGRPINTLFYMPAALGGFSAARLFSIGSACFIVWLTTRVAHKIGIRSLFLIPIGLWFQPWFADLSYTVITEIPFSLCLILSLYLALEDRGVPAALLFGLLPLIRHEAVALTAVWCVYLIFKRRPAVVLIAVMPLLLYNLIYLLVFHRLALEIYLASRPTTLYGSGSWLHFVGPTIQNAGWPLIALSGVSILAWRRLKARLFIFLPYALYFGLHTVLYRFGLFASGGYDLFLLPLAPSIALMAALGVEALGDLMSQAFTVKRAGTIALTLIVCAGVALYGVSNTQPRRADPEAVTAQQAAAWLRANADPDVFVVTTHVWVTYFYFGYITPTLSWTTPFSLNAAAPGTILVWDQHYSPRRGYDYQDLIAPQSGWQLLQEFGSHTLAIFQKTS